MTTLPEHYFLYAEDDPDDQLLFKEVVQRVSPQYSVIVCQQGLELLQFLNSLGPGDPLPCCIVLDINMPIWDGVRTLREIKSNQLYNSLPVVMFTTSQSPRERTVCEQLGAETFISKPFTEEDFERSVRTFTKYCLATVQKR